MSDCDCDGHDHDHHHHHHHHHKWAIIRNPHSGLCLDASDEHVKIEHFTGWDAQLWKMETAEEGRFFLVNKKHGKVLDIQGGAEQGHKIITYERHGGENQQWHINSDGTIVSACHNLALDISRDHFHPGNHLVAWHRHGKHNQRFEFQWQ